MKMRKQHFAQAVAPCERQKRVAARTDNYDQGNAPGRDPD